MKSKYRILEPPEIPEPNEAIAVQMDFRVGYINRQFVKSKRERVSHYECDERIEQNDEEVSVPRFQAADLHVQRGYHPVMSIP
jgi:hypothetical protein